MVRGKPKNERRGCQCAENEKGRAQVKAWREKHRDGRVTYYLHSDYGYGDTMEVTPQDLMALGT